MNSTTHDTTDMTATFSTDPTGLVEATRPVEVALDDGDTYDLRIAPVAKIVGDDHVRMLSYNGSIPGPTLRVRQGSEVLVRVRNDGDTEATVHWHGLRLDNASDGVPFETQPPIEIGGEFTYRLRFPDAGLYWYHPHIREDYGLDMGLYGNIVVEPTDADYWPSVDRDVVVTLDDVLIEDGHVAEFREAGPTHVAMGRYGNVLLTGGETSLALGAQVGEVVRFYFTNTANTRLFNIALPGAPMKLVGGDSGRYEHEQFVDEFLLAPSERAIVDVRLDTPGTTALEHRTPGRTYTLGTIHVIDTAARSSSSSAFDELRTSDELTSWRKRLGDHVARRPDKTLAFESRMPLLYDGADNDTTAAAYVCPMHSEVTSDSPGTCPKCGMKLVPVPTSFVCPMHSEVTSDSPGTCPKCGMKLVPATAAAVAGAPAPERHHHHDAPDGLEWEDLMPEINAASNMHNMIWQLVDVETGKQNGEIDWAFGVGDLVKIRLVNGMDQDHPMHHPFHLHGAGRFLILARDDVVESNLAWKDTVLVRSGETVDILFEVTNPGTWMAHCHIAEHNQAGMMFSFTVRES